MRSVSSLSIFKSRLKTFFYLAISYLITVNVSFILYFIFFIQTARYKLLVKCNYLFMYCLTMPIFGTFFVVYSLLYLYW